MVNHLLKCSLRLSEAGRESVPCVKGCNCGAPQWLPVEQMTLSSTHKTLYFRFIFRSGLYKLLTDRQTDRQLHRQTDRQTHTQPPPQKKKQQQNKKQNKTKQPPPPKKKNPNQPTNQTNKQTTRRTTTTTKPPKNKTKPQIDVQMNKHRRIIIRTVRHTNSHIYLFHVSLTFHICIHVSIHTRAHTFGKTYVHVYLHIYANMYDIYAETHV